ncbi:MAG: type IV secretion system DNA-binding domain-containing protein [Bryobacteraceae bacterium]
MTDLSRPVWPRRIPAFRIVGMALSVALGILFIRAWLVWSATPLQRFYFPTYSRLTLVGGFALPRPGHKGTGFRVVFVGRSLATDASLGNAPAAVSIRWITANAESFRSWLQADIYRGKSLARALEYPLIGLGICFVSLAVAGAKLDRKYDAKAREGRLLRGPSLTGRWRFNRLTKGNGLRFRLTNRRNVFEWLKPGDSGNDLVIKRDREAHHIQIAGDTGSGKSTLIRQIVHQIAAANENAIIFDPDREYIREFFREDRGDWVLNPKDDRCPYWPIGEECDDEAEATPIAIGLFQDEPTRQQFFLSHTRAIFSYLLATYKPTVNELAYWMAHPEEIDKRVVGTEHEHTLTANAAPQRAGILGSLNEAGKPLRMMPTHAEGRQSWSAREWSKNRKGWIFITSTPDTIDALRPLQSLWLDMLILKLQTSAPQPGQARVWMVLDELASLNALPQLHSALTKQRKSDNPIVLGFQGMSQLDAIYGKKAETILSQAYTNIVLRTREPRAAKHLSELIGKAQLERMRESKPSRLFDRKHGSFSTERVIDPVVLESQIQGLEDLTGYFVQQDKVVPIRFRSQPKRSIAPDLIERNIPPVQHRPLDPEPVISTAKPEQVSIGVDMLG